MNHPPIQIPAQTRDLLRELVRMTLAKTARKIIHQEIDVIRRQEVEHWQQAELDEVVRVAFASRVKPIARELTQKMVTKILPDVAEKMILEEIKKIKEGVHGKF